ncbi:DUF6809 family protein [Paenibacillus illinoisensis]|uniref:DUF6809 family protein n=1 Tax=Paenibacillus illinoisensis TaxID=59845 RepID=UPI003D9A01BB
MQSIIEALYQGRLHPNEDIVPSHPEYLHLSQQATAQLDQWRSRLSKDEFCELEEYFDLCDSINSMQIEAAFSYGFKLATNLMIEVIHKGEETVVET